MYDAYYEITRKVAEDQENFMFYTVQPFCEDVVQHKVSKKDLVNALLLLDYAKRLLEVQDENI